jgi:uncharacterized protein (TIGR02145 family)
VSGTITVPPGTNQDQGSCTFTQPELVGTFANFPATYSASTFVTLQDERDRTNYTVVKMPDGKWWMAQNLNYQGTTQGTNTFSLYWNQNSNQANGKGFTTSGAGTIAIGSFWCPAGNGTNVVASSAAKAGCVLFGALYTFETAMMVDGMWSDEARSSSIYAAPTGEYGTYTNIGNTNNNARGITKRGICPPNWHVPTDIEWGNMLSLVSKKGTDFNNGDALLGTDNDAGESGPLLKSKCTCPSSNCVTDIRNDWAYSANTATSGSDLYGFRLVPAGHRSIQGANHYGRGGQAAFWSSSASNSTDSWFRVWNVGNSTIQRTNNNNSRGFSIRCVRD